MRRVNPRPLCPTDILKVILVAVSLVVDPLGEEYSGVVADHTAAGGLAAEVHIVLDTPVEAEATRAAGPTAEARVAAEAACPAVAATARVVVAAVELVAEVGAGVADTTNR